MLNMNLSSYRIHFGMRLSKCNSMQNLARYSHWVGGGVTVASYKGRGVLKRGVV